MARRSMGVEMVLASSLLWATPTGASAESPPAPHRHQQSADHYEHDFSDIARYVKAFEGPERDAWQKPDEVVSLLGLSPGKVVADIGAGTGYFEPRLAKVVGPEGRVLALDVEPHMLTYLRERARKEALTNVTVQAAQGDDPRLGEATVDRILIVDTWHHIPQRSRYAKALNRALRPGGFVVIVDFTAESPEGPPAQHRLSPETVIAELQAGGLGARVVDESLPHQYVVIGQKPGDAKGPVPATDRPRPRSAKEGRARP